MPEDGPKMNDLCDGDPLARALAGLKPAPAGLDVPTLMFRAGQKSRDRDVAVWRRACLTTGVGLFATWCGVYLAYNQLTARPGPVADAAKPQPAPAPDTPGTDVNLAMIGRAIVGGGPRYVPAQPAVSVVSVPVPLAPLAAGPEPDPVTEYLRIRNAVLEIGLAGLPATAPPPAPVSATEFERSFHLPAGVLAAPYRAPRPAKPAESEETEPGL